jgi:hypothetical protein
MEGETRPGEPAEGLAGRAVTPTPPIGARVAGAAAAGAAAFVVASDCVPAPALVPEPRLPVPCDGVPEPEAGAATEAR